MRAKIYGSYVVILVVTSWTGMYMCKAHALTKVNMPMLYVIDKVRRGKGVFEMCIRPHPKSKFINQGWENPNFFWPLYWVFGFNAKNPIPANETMVLFQHSALDNRHHHWQTLSPLPYDLNSFVMKPNKNGFCWTSNDWFLEEKNYEKAKYKKPRGVSLVVNAYPPPPHGRWGHYQT